MSETDKKTKINEYLTNNPITVNYILETPIEKNIYLESIKSLKGYNAIRVNTNVESKVSIQN